MKIIADYHTHTIYSNGKSGKRKHAIGTIEENVQEAIKKGLKKIGISDHGYRHLLYGLNKESVFKMREEIDILNEKYKEIDILLGMECNILDNKGTIDMDDRIREQLDYVLAGYHFASEPTSLRCLLNHADNYLLKTKHSKRYNTDAIVNAMKNNDIFMITHPGDKGEVYIEEIAREAKKRNVILEINSSHNHLNIEQLKKIEKYENRLMIGSDAHKPFMVGNFSNGIETVKKSGIDIKRIENIIE
ncbi:PHP domain-containing protein [Peptacetobacter sp.]|uniref:PHP domain-containing protein n=1 Tax=Peptacetobacter sp. TaxID=2991975 RepID=UPI002615DDE2|nr:PHP domain-containing protein [Peptacetobacter sp.]